MRFLLIGLGSMGKRRIRNLHYLDQRNIVGHDLRSDRLAEAKNLYGIEVAASLNEVDFSSITHVIISTPPDQHMGYATLFHGLGKHVFIEASVVDDDYDSVTASLDGKSNILAPSCTMRFDPLNVQVKKWLQSGKIGRALFCQHQFGMYLPNWHPYEAIGDFYVSKRHTGGAREIVPFDLVYLAWFFGLPEDITAKVSNLNTLGADIDEIYSLNFRTPGCQLVQMSIDVISRVPYRTTRIHGEFGNIELDTVRGEASLFDARLNTWEHLTRAKLSQTKSTEEMYVVELKCFIDATNGVGTYPYSIKEDHQILKCLYRAESTLGMQGA